jgi:hypothetical protein
LVVVVVQWWGWECRQQHLQQWQGQWEQEWWYFILENNFYITYVLMFPLFYLLDIASEFRMLARKYYIQNL